MTSGELIEFTDEQGAAVLAGLEHSASEAAFQTVARSLRPKGVRENEVRSYIVGTLAESLAAILPELDALGERSREDYFRTLDAAQQDREDKRQARVAKRWAKVDGLTKGVILDRLAGVERG
jgi:enoyl-[acyl-carrier-protein] reductase (NADH)